MLTLTKPNFTFSQSILLILLSLMFISCDPKHEMELSSLKELVPKDSVNQLKYIEDAILSYNAINLSISNELNVGKRISRSLSDSITMAWNEKCGPTRAVFFSYGTVMESLLKIPVSLRPTAGIAVVFGVHKTYPTGSLPPDITASITEPVYNSVYAGRNTAVLKYVTGLDNTLLNTVIFEDANGQVIDDLGRPCPANCPQYLFN